MVEIAVWGSQLRDILACDVDRATATSTIPAIQVMWPVLQQAGDAADVCKAALVYSLSETTVEDGRGIPRAKWELTRVARNPRFDLDEDDPDEEFLPCSATWQEFCLVHLGMHKSTASKYKRVWQVYHTRLGYGLDDLFRAGVFKLGAAVSLVDRQIKLGEGVDHRLIVALFGNEHACSLCDGYVPFLTGEAPAECPHCGEDYQGIQPWSGPRTLLLLQQLRGKKEEEGKEGSVNFLGSIESRYDDGGDVIELAFLADYKIGEQKVVLPEWTIPVVDDGAAIYECGIRRGHLPTFRQWLGKKFPGVGV